MKISILIFLLIILILAPFSSRNLNYDDPHTIRGIDLVNRYKNFDFDFEFLGHVYKGFEGTHSIISAYFYDFQFRFLNSIHLRHFVVYFLFALLIFPLYSIFGKKNGLLYSVFLLTSSIYLLNANNFMFDIPAFIFFVWGYFFYVKRDENRLNYIISGICFLFSYLISFIYLFVFFIFLIDVLKNKKRDDIFFISIFAAFTFILLSLFVYFKLAPSPFQALKWVGSTEIFNYKRLALKVLSLSVLIGFFFLPLYLEKSRYSSPFFYLALFFSCYALLIVKYSIFSSIILILLLSNGLYIMFLILKNSADDKNVFWFSMFSFIAILIFPMIVSRYFLILFLPAIILFFKDIDRKVLKAGIILNIILSLLLLYSDMRQTNTVHNSLEELKSEDFYYTGEWAFRSRMEELNGKYLKKNDVNLSEGSLIVIPEGMSSWNPSRKIFKNLKFVKRDSLNTFLLKIYSIEGSAGFYTDEYGIIPFTLCRGYDFKYSIYQYSKKINEYMEQNENKIELWKTHPVIPIEMPMSIELKNVNDLKIIIVPFPEAKKNERIVLRIFHDDLLLKEEIMDANYENSIELKGSYEDIVIMIKAHEESDASWLGVYFE